MSHHAHLLADVRKRAPRHAQPYDRFTKEQLWERLQAAERALNTAASAAQTAATLANNYAQGTSGDDRRRLLLVRDAAYEARDAARGAQ